MYKSEKLDIEIRMLGRILGEVIREQEGIPLYELEEEVRLTARARRTGDDEAGPRLLERIRSMTSAEARVVARAFTIFFDLANLAEDRQRVRVLRERERFHAPRSRSESIEEVIRVLAEAGASAGEIQSLLDSITIDCVFTAHPTEAKRRSIRVKVRHLREYLSALDREFLLPREQEHLITQIRTYMTGLWQTDLVRARRPTVIEEVEVGIYFASTLWSVIPMLYRDLRRALELVYPDRRFEYRPLLRFGSWIGGDRDGNPNVTAAVTDSALAELRRAAIEAHLRQCERAFDSLSPSIRQVAVSPELSEALARALERYPGARALVEPTSPYETYRQYLKLIEWRLREAIRELARASTRTDAGGAYASGKELYADLALMARSLEANAGQRILDGDLQDWLWQTETFGLYLMQLDIRQESAWNAAAVGELLKLAGEHEDYLGSSEAERVAMLTRSLGRPIAAASGALSARAKETLELFGVLASAARRYGEEALGGYIISMTHELSDVLAVLWLASLGGVPIRIIPLFETIDDLRRAPAILEAMLAHPAYAAHLKERGGVQIVMIGYSDSTKDGGYLAANWSLYKAQELLNETAEARGVRITFFHGRGGSLGRGGGPAARSILSLPPETLKAGLRMTEQGEVLAERYDDPQIAYRHLEQVAWATLMAGGRPLSPPNPEWERVMEGLSGTAFRAYRSLVEAPGFLAYFGHATPIEEIESLPIASRPARRHGERKLSDLRAIPWVFAWTQSRHLLPAWYGAGSAFEQFAASNERGWDRLREMYRDWAFFRATIDNAVLAIAKTDMDIAYYYAELVEDVDARERIWDVISQEFERTREALLRINGQSDLLVETPWLQRSIQVRNPNTDPLNLIQIEWLKRLRAVEQSGSEAELAELHELLRLTIQGLAAGMRTTG